MTEAQGPTTGTITWIDLASTDLDHSKAFYTGLFGWDAFTVPEPDAGGYGFFLNDGKQVAGFGPTMGDEAFSAWNTYVSVDDSDATAERVKAAGGQVIAGPMDVFDQGRLTVFTDPTGAFISTWQAAGMQGLQVRNEPNTFCWAELNTRDASAARDFYRAVFGWNAETQESDEGSYTELKRDGTTVAGMYAMGDDVPAEVPSHWRVYFGVQDADAAVARAQKLGGSVVYPVMDFGSGRYAVLADPAGAVFSAIQFT